MTVDGESRTDSFRVSLHAPQSEVSFPSLALRDFIDALTIVYNNNLEVVREKMDLHADVFCITVAEGIGQGFPADSIDLVAHERIDLAGIAFAYQFELRQVAEPELRLGMP